MATKTDYRKLEHILRGVSNHRRIQMLELIDKEPDLDVLKIARRVGINFKNASVHLKRLFLSGHVTRKNLGASVAHRISKRGASVLTFLRTLE